MTRLKIKLPGQRRWLTTLTNFEGADDPNEPANYYKIHREILCKWSQCAQLPKVGENELETWGEHNFGFSQRPRKCKERHLWTWRQNGEKKTKQYSPK